MTGLKWVVAIALGVLLVLCLIVGATLNHHIGGFIETVAREEEEAREQAEAEAQAESKNTGA